MKKYLTGFFYSMPVQMLFLHFKRYQVFLVFWYILFATVGGAFLQPYGANSLFLAPEYLSMVSAVSTAIVGFATGIFVMSWNITTFILHSRHFKFLATTSQPFLKYCINNAIIPVAFLIYYLIAAYNYTNNQELIAFGEFAVLLSGFVVGFLFSVIIAFSYFFGADKTIYHQYAGFIDTANMRYALAIKDNPLPVDEKNEMRIDWFLSAKLHLRKPRDVRHYSQPFLDAIFKRHHLAAVFAILLAFIILISIGFLSDNPVFQVPAAASIMVFFAILIAFAGAVALFLRGWSFPALLIFYVAINWLYLEDIIDLRNKAYGLDYKNKKERPIYEREDILALASEKNVNEDKAYYEQVLNNWKAKQQQDSPVAVIINVSGGGIRSAAFTMNVLQRLDSLTNGELMNHTVLITGASGGMLGAAYFRELYHQKMSGKSIDLRDKSYVENVSKDLLNPLFSSFISRDLVGPAKKFRVNGYEYVKDRAYAFEQKLDQNTGGVLNKKLSDYLQPEASGQIPLIFFNSVVSRDARKVIIATHPARFLMQNHSDTSNLVANDPDALDFTSMFAKQNAGNLRVLSALRMNATFPYALPNVWLPTDPIIDVMDAGLRDNFGQESSMRFLNVFDNWFKKNTGKVILIQIRDRRLGDWDRPFDANSIMGFVTKPLMMFQNNWQRLQDYYQGDQLQYFYNGYGSNFHRISFQYVPRRKEASASISFHLTASEKVDVAAAVENTYNQQSFSSVMELMK